MQKNYDSCQEDLASLYRQHGSLEQKLINLNEDKRNLEELSSEYSAYDLLMTCCHTNGISYDVIKKRLPLINSEISKILKFRKQILKFWKARFPSFFFGRLPQISRNFR